MLGGLTITPPSRGASPHTDGESLVAATALSPDVILVGTRSLQSNTIDQLRTLRRMAPTVGIVLLSFSYDLKGIRALREFSRHASVGCAYLLKHTIDSVEQLVQVVSSVAEGRIIVDPGVMEELVTATEPKSGLLKNLSPREMEVLGWMARGYRNNAIAQILHLEPKTVERHINNIYSKLGDTPEPRPLCYS